MLLMPDGDCCTALPSLDLDNGNVAGDPLPQPLDESRRSTDPRGIHRDKNISLPEPFTIKDTLLEQFSDFHTSLGRFDCDPHFGQIEDLQQFPRAYFTFLDLVPLRPVHVEVTKVDVRVCPIRGLKPLRDSETPVGLPSDSGD